MLGRAVLYQYNKRDSDDGLNIDEIEIGLGITEALDIVNRAYADYGYHNTSVKESTVVSKPLRDAITEIHEQMLDGKFFDDAIELHTAMNMVFENSERLQKSTQSIGRNRPATPKRKF
ncbi:MAG: hypothetical protein HON32_03545 [Francisellaceae bacterium]|jgi:hypothetical protein|nr:hypothetical protein [Francisellaceae bacterium]MBT6538599.1 hypothetical protein [Francisellaceae bacterium]